MTVFHTARFQQPPLNQSIYGAVDHWPRNLVHPPERPIAGKQPRYSEAMYRPFRDQP
jgi:hypothetical protein